jgi:glycosyltransferase involved in cell wall biosynthesis
LRILQLVPRFPYPLIDGGAIGIYKPTQAIAALGHEITMVTFPDANEQVTNSGLQELGKFCRVELVSRPLPSRNATLLRTMFKGAYPIERRMMPEMFELLKKLLSENTWDLVHVDACHMGNYGIWIKEHYGLPVILRQHNFETLIYERFAATTKNPIAKFIAFIHAKRMLKEETRIMASLKHIVAITKQDEEIMQRYVPSAEYSIIPAGVDISYFSPRNAIKEEDSILWIGGMSWEPNRDAIEFFAKEILPDIVKEHPQIRFDIVGEGTETLGIIGGNIQIHGRVPDIRGYLEKAKILICPLRIGGGMRLKLLDFFAAGKVVVSTRIGAEGNIGEDGVHILLRDDARSFAEGVNSLLSNDSLRHTIERNARELAEVQYSWGGIAKQFVSAYEHLLENH